MDKSRPSPIFQIIILIFFADNAREVTLIMTSAREEPLTLTSGGGEPLILTCGECKL
jgi:hypothetical protein